MEIGEEKEKMQNDKLVYCPTGTAYCWNNESEPPLRFLTVKFPALF